MSHIRPDMRVSVTRVGQGLHFRGTGPHGQTVEVDSVDDAPATAKGVSPLTLLPVALGTCSAIDVVSILEKGRYAIDRLDVDVTAERDGGRPISKITAMHAHFDLETDAPPDRVDRAVRLSFSTYCTVACLLSAAVDISASFAINGERVEVPDVMNVMSRQE